MSVGKQIIRLAVLDTQRNKFIALEDYELTNIFSPLQTAQQLQEIIAEHAFLKLTSWNKIRVSIKNQNFTLIPETLFEASAAADYLQINCELDTYHEQVYSYNHPNLEAVNIFAADKYLVQALADSYRDKNILYIHQTSALLNSLLLNGERKTGRNILAYTEKNNLTILIVNKGQLEFCNLFYYTTAEDFMYFLVFVMQEQKLNTDTDTVTIWGDLTHDSNLFMLMRRYIRNVHFGAKPTGVAYSYKLEDQFEHRFLDVYSIHFCE